MDRIEQSSVDILNYIVAFSERNVTEEIRSKALDAITNFDDYRKLVDNMIFVLKHQIETEIIKREDVEDAFQYFRSEYIMLCFNNYIDIRYIENITLVSLKLSALYTWGTDVLWEGIDLAVEALGTCTDEQLKNEIYYLCVYIVNKYNIAKYNLEGIATILEYCRDIDFDDFTIQKLPQSLFAV